MNKNAKIIIVIAIALALAFVAGFMIVKLLSPQRETVYLFRSSYPAGTTLSSDMLYSAQVDKNMVMLGAKSNINQRFVTQSEYASIIRSGDSLKLDVGAGMPLMKSMLSIAGGNSIEMLMKPSAIAVTLGVNGIRGVTNDLDAGSRVNIYYTGGNGTQLLYENMRVLEVSKTSNGGLNSATIEANHEQAQVLINATETGSIYLGLVNASGYQYVETIADPTSASDYLDESMLQEEYPDIPDDVNPEELDQGPESYSESEGN